MTFSPSDDPASQPKERPSWAAQGGPAKARYTPAIFVIHLEDRGETRETAHRKITEGVDRGIHLGRSGLKIVYQHGSSRRKSFTCNDVKNLLKVIAKETRCRLVKDTRIRGAYILWFNR